MAKSKASPIRRVSLWVNKKTGKVQAFPPTPAWIAGPKPGVQVPNPEMAKRFADGWVPYKK